MKKVILILLMTIYSSGHALETVYNNPVAGDTFFSNSTCIDTDPIGLDEGDSGVSLGYAPYHFCVSLGYEYSSSYNIDSSNSEPDVCETNSSTTVTNPAFRFDTSGTDFYTDITCFVNESKVGCTEPNALNYNPNAIMDDNSCFYTDPDTLSGGITNTEVNVDIQPIIEGGFGEDVFDSATIDEIFRYQSVIMVFLMLFHFYYRIIGKRQKSKNFGL